jgi:hypothetical protein
MEDAFEYIRKAIRPFGIGLEKLHLQSMGD